MIWESTLAMTVFDVVIVGIVLLGLRELRRHRVQGGQWMPGAGLMMMGLGIVGAFYALDLVVMTLLPGRVHPSSAIALMESLHLNVKWPVSATSALSVMVGMTISNRALSESSRRRSAIADRLGKVQREERRAIARDLHDEIGQRLTALKLELADLRARLPDGANDLADRVDRLAASADTNISVVQQLATRLRPPLLDELGLIPALEWLTRHATAHAGPRVRFECDLDPTVPTPPPTAEVVFRVAQEALTNAIRHAEASTVSIHLRDRDETLELEVYDDGVGVESCRVTDPESIGFLGMFERARVVGGSLRVWARDDRGTVVCLQVPRVHAPAAEAYA